MMWRAFPIVDATRAAGIDLLVLFNDAFFMSLMFLIGGLYLVPSLAARGLLGFLRERTLRLGVPFVIAAGVLAPLAYYPSYLQHGGAADIAAFWQTWTQLSVWPAGPAWFLWVLLAFGVMMALLLRAFPLAQGQLVRMGRWLAHGPWRFAGALMFMSALCYVSLSHLTDAMAWWEWGPFTVQTARLGLYTGYFMIGAALGAAGGIDTLFERDGGMSRVWQAWQGIAPTVFFVYVGVLVALIISFQRGAPSTGLGLATSAGFALSCAASGAMFISLFARFGHRQGWLARALRENAYGMYLTHYVFVSWLQYVLLDATWSGYAKAAMVFAGTVLLSVAATMLLRRVPGARRVL
jgi:surface polysaccharide O-acyltransferase-like enzyme